MRDEWVLAMVGFFPVFWVIFLNFIHHYCIHSFPLFSHQPNHPPLSLFEDSYCAGDSYCSFTASLLRIATSAYGSAAIWANTTGIHSEWRLKMMGTYCFNYSIQSVWECTNTVDLFRFSLSLSLRNGLLFLECCFFNILNAVSL